MSLNDGGQRQISKAQYGQTKPGLNFNQIREFQIPEPTIALQELFCSRIAQIDEVRAKHYVHLSKLNLLFASIEDRAFRGELTSNDAERQLAIAS